MGTLQGAQLPHRLVHGHAPRWIERQQPGDHGLVSHPRSDLRAPEPPADTHQQTGPHARTHARVQQSSARAHTHTNSDARRGRGNVG
jgi:hypothetical protein